MCYNGLRLIVTLPVRVLETKGTVDAIKKTWDHTRGYAVAALITMVLLGIVIFVISMVGSIIETIFQLPVNLGLLIVASIPVYVFVAFLVGGLTGNIAIFNTILAQIAFYQKIIDAEKAEKAKIIVKPVAAPATAEAKRPAAKPAAKKTSKK
jgi:membrane-anchored glycerophosphoryl diester phosphodiesterase (GDPDase)